MIVSILVNLKNMKRGFSITVYFGGGFHVFSILLGPMEIFFMHVVFGNTFLYGFFFMF